MSLDKNDDNLEAYLRQFRPRQPGDLPERRVIAWRRRIPALVAAAALIVMVLLLFLAQHKPVAPQSVAVVAASDLTRATSLASLSRVVREAPESIDSHLDTLSPRLLPDVQRSTGVLKALAREGDRKDIR